MFVFLTSSSMVVFAAELVGVALPALLCVSTLYLTQDLQNETAMTRKFKSRSIFNKVYFEPSQIYNASLKGGPSIITRFLPIPKQDKLLILRWIFLYHSLGWGMVQRKVRQWKLRSMKCNKKLSNIPTQLYLFLLSVCAGMQ